MSFLHDIWNPWHGCVKCSEGCQNCYMYFLDRMRDQNGAEIYKTKSGFSYPLQKDRAGHYKIQSGEQIRVCMTSDFFLEEADPWRAEAWDIMRQRSDVVFFLLTKRPQRYGSACRRTGAAVGTTSFSTSPVKISAAPMSVFPFCLTCPSSTRASCARPSSDR